MFLYLLTMLSIRYSDVVLNYFPIFPQMHVFKLHFLIYGDLRLREI